MSSLRSIVLALLLAFGLSTGSSMAQTQPDTAQLRQAVALLRDFSRAADLDQWLVTHDAELTPALLDAVQALGRDALKARQMQAALVAAELEMVGRLRRGDRRAALAANIRSIDIRHMLADTVESYEDVRESARRAVDMAGQIGARDLAFRAGITAADAGFFAARIPNISVAARSSFEAGLLEDLDLAAHTEPRQQDADFERFVSLSVATVSDATERFGFGGDEEAKRRAMRKLAPELERIIPPEFRFRILPGKDWRASIDAQAELASLSYAYGTPAIGALRLQQVKREAKQRGESEVWMDLSFQYYRSERDAGRSVTSLEPERQELLDVATADRRRYRSRVGRLWAATRSDNNYTDLLNDQLSQDRVDAEAVFRQVEQLKARLLLDESALDFKPLANPARQEKAAELEHAIIGFPDCLPRQRDLLEREMLLVSQQLIDTSFERGQKAKAVGQLEELYAEEGAGYVDVAPVARLADLRAALAVDEIVVEYFIPFHPLHPAKDLWILMITQDRTALTHLPLNNLLEKGTSITGSRLSIDGCPSMDESGLTEAVLSLRNDLLRSNEVRALDRLKALHTLLIEPIVTAGFSPEQFGRWTIVPHGPLHYLPFAALADKNGRFLIQHATITTAPSASVWLSRRQAAPPVRPRVLLGLLSPKINDPSYTPLLPYPDLTALLDVALPGVRRNIVTGTKATVDALRSNAAQAGLLHIATHGDFPERDAIDFHEIRLASGGNDDGKLTARDVRSLDLSGNGLVLLEICNGGLYNVGPSDEPYGLIPAFLVAGARNVSGTLWPLEDANGREFMRRFYGYLIAAGPAGALRRTMESFIAEDELIRRWASFIVVGDGTTFW